MLRRSLKRVNNHLGPFINPKIKGILELAKEHNIKYVPPTPTPPKQMRFGGSIWLNFEYENEEDWNKFHKAYCEKYVYPNYPRERITNI